MKSGPSHSSEDQEKDQKGVMMDSPDETQAYPADQGTQEDQGSAPKSVGQVPEERLGHGRGKAENRGQNAGLGEGELEFFHQEGEHGGEKGRVEIIDEMTQGKKSCLAPKRFPGVFTHTFSSSSGLTKK
jgi:hypothetical protein